MIRRARVEISGLCVPCLGGTYHIAHGFVIILQRRKNSLESHNSGVRSAVSANPGQEIRCRFRVDSHLLVKILQPALHSLPRKFAFCICRQGLKDLLGDCDTMECVGSTKAIRDFLSQVVQVRSELCKNPDKMQDSYSANVRPINALKHGLRRHILSFCGDNTGDMICSIECARLGIVVAERRACYADLQLIVSAQSVLVNWDELLDIIQNLAIFRLIARGCISDIVLQISETCCRHRI